jgi:hypothetical protein
MAELKSPNDLPPLHITGSSSGLLEEGGTCETVKTFKAWECMWEAEAGKL